MSLRTVDRRRYVDPRPDLDAQASCSHPARAQAGTSLRSLAIDEAVSEKGIVVDRMDFPYRLAGRRAPTARRSWSQPSSTQAGIWPDGSGQDRTDIALGGRSMGGRMASVAVAEGLPAAGLVLVSYPLHPPGRPEKSRIEHLGRSRFLACSFPGPATPSAPAKSSNRPPA